MPGWVQWRPICDWTSDRLQQCGSGYVPPVTSPYFPIPCWWRREGLGNDPLPNQHVLYDQTSEAVGNGWSRTDVKNLLDASLLRWTRADCNGYECRHHWLEASTLADITVVIIQVSAPYKKTGRTLYRGKAKFHVTFHAQFYVSFSRGSATLGRSLYPLEDDVIPFLLVDCCSFTIILERQMLRSSCAARLLSVGPARLHNCQVTVNQTVRAGAYRIWCSGYVYPAVSWQVLRGISLPSILHDNAPHSSGTTVRPNRKCDNAQSANISCMSSYHYKIFLENYSCLPIAVRIPNTRHDHVYTVQNWSHLVGIVALYMHVRWSAMW